jgi:hypothetical protein
MELWARHLEGEPSANVIAIGEAARRMNGESDETKRARIRRRYAEMFSAEIMLADEIEEETPHED